MPRPLSDRRRVAHAPRLVAVSGGSPSLATARTTWPLAGVNLSALSRRFAAIRATRWRSARTAAWESSVVSATPLAAKAAVAATAASRATSARSSSSSSISRSSLSSSLRSWSAPSNEYRRPRRAHDLHHPEHRHRAPHRDRIYPERRRLRRVLCHPGHHCRGRHQYFYYHLHADNARERDPPPSTSSPMTRTKQRTPLP